MRDRYSENQADTEAEIEVYFVGTLNGFERPLVEKSGFPVTGYDEVRAGPLHGVSPLKAVQSVIQLSLGVLQAFGVLRRRQPEVILSTGGWASFPIAVAAWFLRIPLVIYLPDIEPGLTIKALSPFATKICVTTPASAPYFSPKKMVVTGYPLRKGLLGAKREDGLAHFELDPARKTILVMGGSRGSRSINTAIVAITQDIIAAGGQILHITGELDKERVITHPHYHPFPYLHQEMGLALAASDLVVCRAGASVLGELPLFGLASILVPYPYVWRYQKVNADYMTDHGAAIYLDDAKMSEGLLPILRDLLHNQQQLAQMQQNARRLAVPEAADHIVQTLIDAGAKKP